MAKRRHQNLISKNDTAGQRGGTRDRSEGLAGKGHSGRRRT
jgi:hypothetical protein